MEPTLSIIVGTLGRPHLARTIRSLTDQDEPVEIIVVPDAAGDVEHAHRVCRYFGLVRRQPVASVDSQRGDDQKNAGMAFATGTHLAFLDDDDEATPGSLGWMKERACETVVIFRMAHPRLGLVWKTPVVRFGNIGTPCLLVPNQTPGQWAPFLGLPSEKRVGGGDYHFLMTTLEALGTPEVMWDERVVCQVNPT